MSKPVAHVINLDRRPERWQQAQQHWSPYFDLVRFPAVDCPGRGADGCKQSHVQLAEKVLASHQMAIVLEDDAVPTQWFKESGQSFIEAAWYRRHYDWDYINCGPCIDPQLTGRNDITLAPSPSRLFLKSNFSYRTHFVLYNESSLRLLKASLDTKEEIDVWLGVKSKNQWLPIHVLATQSEGVSDIRKPGKEHLFGYETTERMLQEAVPKACVACYVPPGSLLMADSGLPRVLFSESAEYGNQAHQLRGAPPSEEPARGNALFLTACILAMRRGFTHVIYVESGCQIQADKVWNEYCEAGRYRAFSGDGAFIDGIVSNLSVVNELLKFTDGGTLEKARSMAPYPREIGAMLYRTHGSGIRDHVVKLNSLLDAPQYPTPPVQLKPLIVAGSEPTNVSEAGASESATHETAKAVTAGPGQRVDERQHHADDTLPDALRALL